MLGAIKRMFSASEPPPQWAEVAQWAQRRGLGFKRARDGAGFVVDGRLEGRPWRLEWGPPQRAYIEGQELRLRMELDLPSELQLLVLSRPLMELLEKQTFERFTQGLQTQIDTATPEEMRWLVMFPKVDLSGQRALRSHFGVVASLPEAGLAWLNGPLARMLEDAVDGLLRDAVPFVLMTLRGRTYLRMRLDSPDPQLLSAALALFETAVAQAVQAVAGHTRNGVAWPATANTAWQTLAPDDIVPPDKDT
jgi:hypothetical protein